MVPLRLPLGLGAPTMAHNGVTFLSMLPYEASKFMATMKSS